MPCFKVVCISVFLAVLCMAKAQTLKFEQFTTRDGLLSDEVYNLHQDKKGYIWLFTHNGPMHYNGKAFTRILKNLPFNESVIYSFYENERGRKWFANSNKNIYEIINDSAFRVKGTEHGSGILKKRAQEIYQVYVDDSLNIYTKTLMFTFKFAKEAGYKETVLNTSVNSGPYSEEVMVFENACMGILNDSLKDMFSFKTNVLKFTDKTGGQKNLVVKCSGQAVARYYKKLGGDLYFSFYDKLFRVDSKGMCKEVFSGEYALNFTKDKNGHLWVATHKGGLLEFDGNDSLVGHYLKGITVNDVLVDSENGLWVSTDGSGLYHCANTDEYYYQEPLAAAKPVSFMKKIGEDIFIGTTSVAMLRISKGALFEVAKDNFSLNDDPMDIIKTGGRYIVSYRMHNEQLIYKKQWFAKEFPPVRPFFVPNQFLELGPDSVMLLTRNSIMPLSHLFPAMCAGILPPSIPIKGKAFDFEERKGQVLIATDEGVFCFEKDSVYRPYYLEPTKKSIITKIRKDKLNNFWICTKGDGLYRLNIQNELAHYTGADGIPVEIINDLYFLDDNSFLMSGNSGLYFHPATGTGKFPFFKKILNGEVQTALFYDDHIYAGTKNGLVVLNSRVLSKKPVLYFNLKSILVNTEPVHLSKLNDLAHKSNTLEFQFDVISYSGDTYPVAYRLSGATIDTGTVYDDALRFSQLPPGSYTLVAWPLVNGQAAKEKISREFTIVPAFWQTNWFSVLSVLLLIATVMFGTWLILRYYKNREMKRTEAEKMIAEYRLIALKAQINPHFMSNCIAAIQHLIIHNKVDEANEYLAKFSFLVRQVLNLSTKPLVPLKEEIEIISLYITLEKLRFDKIKVEFYVDPGIDPMEIVVPPLLLQPIIENAIWHGLLPLDPAKTGVLSVSITMEKGMLKIIVKDNGVGRKRERNSISNTRESKGIAITMQRIENLKYLSDQHTAGLVYEDLTDEKGNPEGTKVVISLPGNLQV